MISPGLGVAFKVLIEPSILTICALSYARDVVSSSLLSGNQEGFGEKRGIVILSNNNLILSDNYKYIE